MIKASSPCKMCFVTTNFGESTFVNMCSKMVMMAVTPFTSLNGSLKKASELYRSPSKATFFCDKASKVREFSLMHYSPVNLCISQKYQR